MQGYAQPSYGQAAYGQPSYAQPSYAQASYAQPAYAYAAQEPGVAYAAPQQAIYQATYQGSAPQIVERDGSGYCPPRPSYRQAVRYDADDQQSYYSARPLRRRY